MSTRLLPALLALLVLVGGTHVSLGARDGMPAGWAAPDEAALRELLEGPGGQREVWDRVPELVVLGGVVEFAPQAFTHAYRATGESIAPEEIEVLVADLTSALAELTDYRLERFAEVRVESLAEGDEVSLFRRGQVVVGRFAGVREQMGTLGYGGRTARRGTITAGAVILDAEFDGASADRRILRTHELAHALGYNHVEARPSIMNPRVGTEMTTFDRLAVAVAQDLGFAFGFDPISASARR